MAQPRKGQEHCLAQQPIPDNQLRSSLDIDELRRNGAALGRAATAALGVRPPTSTTKFGSSKTFQDSHHSRTSLLACARCLRPEAWKPSPIRTAEGARAARALHGSPALPLTVGKQTAGLPRSRWRNGMVYNLSKTALPVISAMATASEAD